MYFVQRAAEDKLAQNGFGTAVEHIRHAFEQLSTKRAAVDTDFGKNSAQYPLPARSQLSEADFARIVDRLGGAMAGFCHRDETKAPPDAEPSGIQRAGQSETLPPQQNARPEADAEPWWSTSEQAMGLLILIWLCAAIDGQLR